MIQNILTFCVKNDLTFVEGSIPSGKLVANDINRNSIYLVTPYDEAIVKANFQTNLQSDTPTSVLGILVNGKITIDEIVPTSKSYYNLVKDWNIYEFKVPSTTLSFISRNRTGKIGINFSIEQRLVPTIKPSYGEYQGEILSLGQVLTESGYYINKTIGFELDTGADVFTYGLNDILVLTKQESPLDDIQVKISAYSNRGSTPTSLYSVDPSLLNDNFETIEPSLTMQIVQQVNDNTGDIVLLFQNIGVNNATLVGLENRMSVAEQDIDTAEGNITNLQGRMATAESDIENIEDGTTIVEKALRDSLGNIIKDHYVASVIPTYDDNTNNFYLNPYNGNDSLMPTRVEGVTLPKATTFKDGLLAKEDKIKINAIASDIASAISTHDGSQTSHLYIRTLINDLQKEVDRINAKGRSWGEVDKTFSELWAMAEPTRSDYINTFLATAFSGYTPSNGDLVYTIVSDTEEEHELEYNSTLSQWVDNGAYIVGKASNDQYGIVKGDLNYVSILNGIIQVLKSDYATNVGSSGASYDYGDLLALFTEVANDIYNKSETYSRAEVDLLISNLSHYFNLQETAIEYSTGVYDFPNGATKSYTLFQDYTWVKFRVFNNVSGRARAYYTFIKPAMAVSGNSTLVQIQRTPVRYARIRRTNGDIVFDIIDDNDNVDTSADYTMRCWGEELVQLTTSEITHKTTETLEHYLDNLDSDQVYFNSGLEDIESLVVNGNLTVDSNSDGVPDGFVYSANTTNKTLTNGIASFTATTRFGRLYQEIVFNANDLVYYYASVKSDSNLITLIGVANIPQANTYHSGNNEFEFLSNIQVASGLYNTVQVSDTRLSGWTPISIDYIGAYNVSIMKLKGVKNDGGVPFSNLTNEEIKSQLDIWVQSVELGKQTLRERFTEIDTAINTLENRVTSAISGGKDNLLLAYVSGDFSWIDNYYYYYINGAQQGLSSCSITNKIDISKLAGGKVRVYTRMIANTGICFWDENNTFISGTNGSGSTATAVFMNYDIDVPSNAKYIAISCLKDYKAQVEMYFGYSTKIEGTEKSFTNISMFNSIGCCGDSYTKAQFYNADGLIGDYTNNSWGKVLGRKCGLNASIFATSGDTTGLFITRTLPSLLADSAKDLYIFALGINDVSNTTLGTIADINDGDPNQNPNTFYGNYGKILTQVMAHAPNAKILLMKSLLPANSIQYNYSSEAIEEIAEHYGIGFLETYNNPFLTSSLYVNGMRGSHPTPALQSGMAKCIEELVNDVMTIDYSYFRDYVPRNV